MVLSLFDGAGTMRVALDHLLRSAGMEGRLAGSFFAESNVSLGRAVERAWGQEAAARNIPPHTCVAFNVWDLLHSPRILRNLLDQVPLGALFLVAGGPPCQDLTKAGASGGAAGVAGARSSDVYAFPAICRVVQVARPDLTLHVMVENAGSILPPHRQVILSSLGLPSSAGPIIDAGPWSHFTRSHTFFSSLPHEPGPPPAPRPTPFEDGWAPHALLLGGPSRP